MKKLRLLPYIIGVIGLLMPEFAAAKTDLTKYHLEITELSVDENIQSPEMPSKLEIKAREAMASLSRRFEREKFKTDLSEREGLVLMVTLPVAELFNANDTLLSNVADSKLRLFANAIRTPDRYKLLVVVHSDDTGSEDYLNNLTRSRADAIRRRFADMGIPVDGVVPYGMGYDEPINSDVSRRGRSANRRVEFYFIPGPIMIEELKLKK